MVSADDQNSTAVKPFGALDPLLEQRNGDAAMPTALIATAGTAVTLLVLDILWIMTSTGWLYRPQLGEMLAPQPNLVAGGVFYVLLTLGVVALVVMPAAATGSWTTALWMGGLLGLVAYGAYGFTNLAILKDWPLIVTIIDTAWGIFVTAAAALGGFLAVRWLGA
jgi:uncharacterized membrane protein